jgi:hypothetical protein
MLSPKNWRRVSAELLLCLSFLPLFFLGAKYLLLPADVWAESSSIFVRNWWAGLCAIGALNICLLLVSFRAFALRPELKNVPRRNWQLILAAIYVLGCAQRSFWPKVDVQRFCFVDGWLSSIFVGRSIATIAEVSFAAQLALLLNEYSRQAQFKIGIYISYFIVPLLAAAQCFCWYSVITTSFLGHIIEESLWAFSAALLTGCAAALWRQAQSHRGFLGAILAFGIAYVAYMATVDVPMYVMRFWQDQAASRPLLSLSEGLQDVLHRRVVSLRWEDWASEISWLSLYFSLGVWGSLGCAHVPPAGLILKKN